MIAETIATEDGPLLLWRAPGAAGPPLLWVHGYTLDSSLWRQLWQLLPGYGHVGLDLPGHGGSRAYRPGDDLSGAARAVRQAADAVGAQDVVAMSFGATVTLLAAAADPDRFRALVLAAPALPGGPEDQDAADCNQELLRLNREQGHGPWLAERWLAEPPAIFSGARRDPELFGAIASVVARHRWGELNLPAFARADMPRLQSRLARISAKLLLMLGDDEIASFVRTAELIRRSVPRCETVWVPEAGHLVLLEKPQDCALHIAKALGDVGRAASPAGHLGTIATSRIDASPTNPEASD